LKKEWAARSKIKILKKGHLLVEEGKRSSSLWFIASGGLRAYYTKDGKKICDWFAFKNEFICALSSFYSRQPSFHRIDLLSDAVLLETSRDDIATLCEMFHEFERLGRLSTTIGGQLTLVNPLLQSELSPQITTEWLGAWHIVTILLWVFGFILFRNGRKVEREDRSLIRTIGLLSFLFGLTFIIASLIQGQHAPQYILFLPIAVCVAVGNKRNMELNK